MQEKDSIKSVDYFGFLKDRTCYSFEGGSLVLVEDFDEALKWIDKYTNKDGFIYPPLKHSAIVNPKSGKTRKIPKTERPSLLYRVPASHKLILDRVDDPKALRNSLAGFVLQCFAFLFGTRLHFWDWWIWGRIPIRPSNDFIPHRQNVMSFISKANMAWNALDRDSKIEMQNLLFLHSLAGSLEWDWEKFLFEYFVTDACFAISKRRHRVKARSHLDQFDALCRQYKLAPNKDLFKLFAGLRNRFVHNALWDGGSPGDARSSESFYATIHLRKFNSRLITAILTGQSNYSSSTWWYLGQQHFDV